MRSAFKLQFFVTTPTIPDFSLVESSARDMIILLMRLKY